MLDPNKYKFVSVGSDITLAETKTDGWANLKCIVTKSLSINY